MDNRERYHDPQEALRAAIDATMIDIWTAMPGIIQSWNPAANTCEVIIAIREKVMIGQTTQDVEIHPLLDCPVHFPAGGGVTMTFPLKPGDECLVVIASRCIDAWWASGGTQNGKITTQVQQEFRMHDLSDGFVIPKVWSRPAVIPSISTDSAQIRTTNGSAFVELKEDGNINITTDQDVTMTAANVTINAQAKIHMTAGTEIRMTGPIIYEN